jgi:hypothetical protein
VFIKKFPYISRGFGFLGIDFQYRPAWAGPVAFAAAFAVVLVYGVIYSIVDKDSVVLAFKLAGSAGHTVLGVDLETELEFFWLSGHVYLPLLYYFSL